MKIRHDLLNVGNFGLAWSFHVSPDSCDNPSYYSQFIQLSAMGDQKRGQALTHLLIDEDSNLLAGYVSLRVTSLITRSETGAPVVHPALEIAELAVDGRYERKGIGSELVNIALGTADLIRSQLAGVRYIAVCADPAAVGFYEKEGFSRADSLYDVPRDGWNDNCIPLYVALPEE